MAPCCSATCPCTADVNEGWDAEQEHKFWEEAFQAYERGVALFKYPHVKDIWQAYLSRFVERYKGTKLERARDLFRQALSQVLPGAGLTSCPCTAFPAGTGLTWNKCW